MPSQLRYNSSAPISYLGWSWTGSFTNTSRTFTHSFNHGLPFTPLLVGYYTTAYTGNTKYDISSYEGGTLVAPITVTADNTKVYIAGFDRTPDMTTVTFHLAGFVPPDYDGDVTPVEDNSNFRFSSDFRYPKLNAFGKLTAGSGATMVYNHNLGYIPQTRTWLIHSNGRVNSFNGPTTYSGDLTYMSTSGSYVDSQKLTIYKHFDYQSLESSPVTGAYYQIFEEGF